MADFDFFNVKVIDRYFSFLEKRLILTKRRRMTFCASKSVQPFRCTLIKERKKLKKRKKKEGRTLMCWVYVSDVSPLGSISPKPNFGRLFRSMTLSILPNIFSIGCKNATKIQQVKFQVTRWYYLNSEIRPPKQIKFLTQPTTTKIPHTGYDVLFRVRVCVINAHCVSPQPAS